MRVTEDWLAAKRAERSPLPAALRAHPGDCSEAEFQRRVIAVATHLGWTYYHTHDSRRSPAGFPDLVLVRERILFRELKTDGGRLRKGQTEWLAALKRARADAKTWRPSDWADVLTTLA